MTEEHRSVDEVLGPPSFREHVIAESVKSLAAYDYGIDADDEVEHALRVKEASWLLADVAPLLIEHGREQAARETVPSRNLTAWDGMAAHLRLRDGWRVGFEDGSPWWHYRPDPDAAAYLGAVPVEVVQGEWRVLILLTGVWDEDVTLRLGEFLARLGDFESQTQEACRVQPA